MGVEALARQDMMGCTRALSLEDVPEAKMVIEGFPRIRWDLYFLGSDEMVVGRRWVLIRNE